MGSLTQERQGAGSELVVTCPPPTTHRLVGTIGGHQWLKTGPKDSRRRSVKAAGNLSRRHRQHTQARGLNSFGRSKVVRGE